MRALKHLIRRGILSLLLDDSSDYPLAQITYNGISTDAMRMGVYGVSSQPPLDSLAMVLSPFARLDDPVAVIDDVLGRFKGLKEGEVQLGNYITRSSVKFEEDGSITIDLPNGGDMKVALSDGDIIVDAGSGDVTLTAGTTTINGDLIVTGTVTGQTEVVGGAGNVRLSQHQHVISGGSSAGTTASTVP